MEEENSIQFLIHNSKMLLDALVDPFFITDKKLRIQYINQKALDMFGYQKHEVINQKTCSDFLKTNICKTKSCAIGKSISQKCSVVCESIAKTKHGKSFDIREGCNMIYDESGNIIGGYRLIQGH